MGDEFCETAFERMNTRFKNRKKRRSGRGRGHFESTGGKEIEGSTSHVMKSNGCAGTAIQKAYVPLLFDRIGVI